MVFPHYTDTYGWSCLVGGGSPQTGGACILCASSCQLLLPSALATPCDGGLCDSRHASVAGATSPASSITPHAARFPIRRARLESSSQSLKSLEKINRSRQTTVDYYFLFFLWLELEIEDA